MRKILILIPFFIWGCFVGRPVATYDHVLHDSVTIHETKGYKQPINEIKKDDHKSIFITTPNWINLPVTPNYIMPRKMIWQKEANKWTIQIVK